MSGHDLPTPPAGHGVVLNGRATDWLARYDAVALVSLGLLPLAVLAAWLLARHRGRTSPRGWARRSAACDVGLVCGTAPWVWLTMLPGSGAGVAHARLSLVPLHDLATMPAYQVLGNLCVLAAVGALAPVRWAALASGRRVLALAAACSLLIEATQYVLPLDRVASVDDVLLNTLGAGLAALASRPWWRVPLRAGTGGSERDGARRTPHGSLASQRPGTW